MFFLFKQGKLVGKTDREVSGKDLESIKIDFTEDEIYKLDNGCLYQNDTIVETDEYLEKIKEDESEKIKKEKDENINDIATLSDQLNLMAGVIDKLADELIKINPDLANDPLIILAKETYIDIQNILNN